MEERSPDKAPCRVRRTVEIHSLSKDVTGPTGVERRSGEKKVCGLKSHRKEFRLIRHEQRKETGCP